MSWYRCGDEQGNQATSAGRELGPDPDKGFRRVVVVRQQVERGAGKEDRPILARQVHGFDRTLVEYDFQAGRFRSPPTPMQHVGRRVEAFDIQSAAAQRQERVAITATQLQGRLSELADEPS